MDSVFFLHPMSGTLVFGGGNKDETPYTYPGQNSDELSNCVSKLKLFYYCIIIFPKHYGSLIITVKGKSNHVSTLNLVPCAMCHVSHVTCLVSPVTCHLSPVTCQNIIIFFYIFLHPHYTTLHCTTLHYTILKCTTLHYTILHYSTLHYTALYYTKLHYITLHYTTQHYTTLHYTTLHYNALHMFARLTLETEEVQRAAGSTN